MRGIFCLRTLTQESSMHYQRFFSALFITIMILFAGNVANAEEAPTIPLPTVEAKCRTSTTSPVINICIPGLGCSWYTSVSPPTVNKADRLSGRHMAGILAQSMVGYHTTKSKLPKPEVCVPIEGAPLLICNQQTRECIFYLRVPGGKPVFTDRYFDPDIERVTAFDILREKDVCDLDDLFINPQTGVLLRESPIRL